MMKNRNWYYFEKTELRSQESEVERAISMENNIVNKIKTEGESQWEIEINN